MALSINILLAVTIYLVLFNIMFTFILGPSFTQLKVHNHFHANSISRSSVDQIQDEENSFSLVNSSDSFSDSFARPVPSWYLNEKILNDNYARNVEIEREKTAQEFKLKYEISEEEKMKMLTEKWDRINSAMVKKSKEKRSWIPDVFGKRKAEESDSELLTKEKWESIWADKKKDPDFYLPGFFEVFPELKLKWPKWTRTKQGKSIRCESDSDCQFPESCCQHPIFLGESFCCTGWGRRAMVPQYCPQEISAGPRPRNERDSGNGAADAEEKRPWAPS